MTTTRRPPEPAPNRTVPLPLAGEGGAKRRVRVRLFARRLVAQEGNSVSGRHSEAAVASCAIASTWIRNVTAMLKP